MKWVFFLGAAFFAGYWVGLKHSEILFADAVRHINKSLDKVSHLIKTNTKKDD
jgi:hypothetical protein